MHQLVKCNTLFICCNACFMHNEPKAGHNHKDNFFYYNPLY
jgi:hypothetical protein